MLKKAAIALGFITGVDAQTKAYKSGEVKTREKFTYGKFVARIMCHNKPGTVTSFFTFWDGPDWSIEGWNEIDIELVPSITDNPFSTNIISEN